MLNTPTCTRGMITAPHHLAADAGLAVLRDGGNAIEAMLAAAATIAVVYPHMNSIGGDGFWLIKAPGAAAQAIDACGPSGQHADRAHYADRGLSEVPSRGSQAALTVAGTVDGWRQAQTLARSFGGTLGLERLFEDAIFHAERGVPVTASQAHFTREKLSELRDSHGFVQAFLNDGVPYTTDALFKQPRLANTLSQLASAGLESFYKGDLAKQIAADLARAGSPLVAADLARYEAALVKPLSCELSAATVYNLPPPTQGIASLIILALFERMNVKQGESFAHLHGLIEATKQAFLVRDKEVTDPAFMHVDPQSFLADNAIERMLQRIDQNKALPWPASESHGDTIWMGAIDSDGLAVSFIQSIYWEFGSGVVLDESGILWQNRGASFKLQDDAINALAPGKKPFHTLNPPLATFADGRTMVFGTMGGEGQPQTQAAIFSRYAQFAQPLQAAVTAPRWLLGRTWGEETTTLKVESRLDQSLTDALVAAGHNVEVLDAYSDSMGHAGAVVRHVDGVLEGASDPRSDGQARGY